MMWFFMWVTTFAWIIFFSTRFNVIFGAISIHEVVSGFMAVTILFKPCYFCHYFTLLINHGEEREIFFSQLDDQ